MDSISLTNLGAEQLATARSANSGRASHTVHGGHDHFLRQTLVTLAAGNDLDEHESPGEATLLVLQGRARVDFGEQSVEVSAGDFLVLPAERHSLAALEDLVVLLTVVKHIA
jgi:quercetin dioxygenase-like cupin family protein